MFLVLQEPFDSVEKLADTRATGNESIDSTPGRHVQRVREVLRFKSLDEGTCRLWQRKQSLIHGRD